MQQLFEKLQKLNVIRRNKLKLETLDKISFSNTLDLIDEMSAATVGVDESNTLSSYTNSASLSLGGERYSCSAIGCRRKKLNELARFAALYSDQVHINNFVASYSPTFGHPPDKDNEHFREYIRDDLRLLLEIRPLIESGSIRLFTLPSNYCPICFAERVLGIDTGRRIKSVSRILTLKVLGKLSVEIRYDEEYENPYEIHELGLEDIFGHSIYRSEPTLPELIKDDRKRVRQLRNGKTIRVTKEQLRKGRYAEWVASKLLRNCTYHLSVSSVFDSTPVTDHDIDVSILSHMTNNAVVEKRNHITLEHLKAIV